MRAKANLLSLSRLVLAPLLAWCVLAGGGWGWIAAAVFAWAAWSDVYDGRLARWDARPSSWGRWMDHGSDIGFLLISMAAFCWVGVLPWWVPVSIACAFAAYVVEESQGRRFSSALASRVGHWGGVANFVLLGVLIGQFSLDLRALPPWLLQALFAAVPAYSLAPVALRLRGSRRAHFKALPTRS